jgi:aquaporin Z
MTTTRMSGITIERPGLIIRQTPRAGANKPTLAMARCALALHWHLYIFEASELAIFMFAACAFSVWLFDPASAPANAIPSALVRQVLFAVAMGLIAIFIIKSPMGKRSGAHFNPACTLTYLRLGRIARTDAAFYVLAHFTGAIAGVALPIPLFGKALALPGIDYAASVPGCCGTGGALGAELFMAISFMTIVLWTANRPKWSKTTAYLVGAAIALDLIFFGHVSGVGLNPARTLGSAVFANVWTALWVYFIAPGLGMLIAAEIYLRTARSTGVLCAKVDTTSRHPCPFICSFPGHSHTWEKGKSTAFADEHRADCCTQGDGR